MTSSYGWAVFETMLTLLGVCLLAVVSLKWLAKRGVGVGQKGTEMSVLDRMPLDARRSLVIVRVREQTLLLGLGESGAPTLLAELRRGDFREALAARDVLSRVGTPVAPEAVAQSTEGIGEIGDRRIADDPGLVDRRVADDRVP